MSGPNAKKWSEYDLDTLVEIEKTLSLKFPTPTIDNPSVLASESGRIDLANAAGKSFVATEIRNEIKRRIPKQ